MKMEIPFGLGDAIDLRQFFTALTGALTLLAIQRTYRFYQEYHGPYSGEWKTEIYGPDGAVIKVDHLKIKQRGKVLHGEIKRISPSEQNHRKWHMQGRIKGHDFYSIFWPPDDSIFSFGCWLVHQKDDKTFEGFYLRLNDSKHNEIIKVPLSITRIESHRGKNNNP